MSDVSLAVAVGLVCALLSALGTNLAFLFKHKGAVAAPDVDMRHPVRSAIDLFGSRWWSIGWGVAAVAFALHVAALSLAPLSIGQAVLAGGLVFLAVLAERFFGFELGRRQWIGIGLVAVSLTLLTLTGGGGGGGAHADYSLAGMIIVEGISTGRGPTKGQGHHLLRPRHGHTRRACRDARWRTCSRRFRRGRRRRGFLGCREAVAEATAIVEELTDRQVRAYLTA